MSRRFVLPALTVLALCGAAVAPSLQGTPFPLPTTATTAPAPEVVTPPPTTQAERATVELVFVLDTTSSMSGLIEGAKETIWSVVNDFSSQQPRPEIRVGLVAFRDRGDAYVTQVTALTDDLDAVYSALAALRAQGGGDSPESVVAGLQQAVDQQPWSQEGRVFRSIFVVGDAPDHRYSDEPTAQQVVDQAREKNIYVNAIQCGNMHGTKAVFELIAKAGAGTYVAVAQDGEVERLRSPHDERLEQLQTELSNTALPWGSRSDKSAVEKKLREVASSSGYTKASRLAALSKGGGKVVTSYGRGDLLDDLDADKVALADVRQDELPEALSRLSPEERTADVKRRIAERTRLQAEIDGLVAKRDGWLAEQRSKDAEKRYDRVVVEESLEALKEIGYIY